MFLRRGDVAIRRPGSSRTFCTDHILQLQHVICTYFSRLPSNSRLHLLSLFCPLELCCLLCSVPIGPAWSPPLADDIDVGAWCVLYDTMLLVVIIQHDIHCTGGVWDFQGRFRSQDGQAIAQRGRGTQPPRAGSLGVCRCWVGFSSCFACACFVFSCLSGVYLSNV